MTTEIDGIVQSLRGASDTSAALAKVREWAASGQTQLLVDLWTAIEASADQTMPYESVADEIEERLALAKGKTGLAEIFDLTRRERVKSVRRPRSSDVRARAIASRLGYAKTKAEFIDVLERYADRTELLACFMHEVVLRGTSLADEPAAKIFTSLLAKKNHPLSALPLTLLASEREAPSYMPMYGDDAIAKAVARLESGPQSTRTVPPRGDHANPTITRIEDAAVEARLAVALRPWVDGSNGVVEPRVFSLAPAIAHETAGKWLLRALPLASTEGLGDDVLRVDPDVVWGALFSAASNGGAYTSGFGGAYGRKSAWTSFAALVGQSEASSIAEIDEAARRSSLLMYGTTSWFQQVAWDLGIVALREDGASVAVLAATDCD